MVCRHHKFDISELEIKMKYFKNWELYFITLNTDLLVQENLHNP